MLFLKRFFTTYHHLKIKGLRNENRQNAIRYSQLTKSKLSCNQEISNNYNFLISHIILENPVDTGRKLNVHKTFRRRPGRLLNVLCTFNLRPVPIGK